MCFLTIGLLFLDFCEYREFDGNPAKCGLEGEKRSTTLLANVSGALVAGVHREGMYSLCKMLRPLKCAMQSMEKPRRHDDDHEERVLSFWIKLQTIFLYVTDGGDIFNHSEAKKLPFSTACT